MKKAIVLFIVFILFSSFMFGAGIEEERRVAEKTYPSRPINVIIPWAAGGGTDVTARGFLKVAEKYVGATFVPTNITGGAGAVGWASGKNAEADGYNLVILTADYLTHSIKHTSGISIDDFIPIINISKYPACLAVDANSPWKDFESFIADAKKNPGTIQIGNSGIGGSNHQAALMIEEATGAEFIHVPFSGGALSIAAVLGGNIEASLANTPEISPRSDMRMLVQHASGERNASALDTPTLKELGYDVDFESFRMIGVLKDTPPERVKFLDEKFKQAWKDPEFQEFAKAGDLSPEFLNAEESKKLLNNMYEQISYIINKYKL